MVEEDAVKKEDKTPVTVADLAAQAFVCQTIVFTKQQEKNGREAESITPLYREFMPEPNGRRFNESSSS